MTDTLCITCGSPVQVVGGVTQSYEPITAYDRSYVRVVTQNDKLREQLAVTRDALLSVIECDGIMGCETVDLALEALARCKELENE